MLSTSIAVVLERLGDDESRLRDLDDDVSGRDLREDMRRKLRRFLCMRFYQTPKNSTVVGQARWFTSEMCTIIS